MSEQTERAFTFTFTVRVADGDADLTDPYTRIAAFRAIATTMLEGESVWASTPTGLARLEIGPVTSMA